MVGLLPKGAPPSQHPFLPHKVSLPSISLKTILLSEISKKNSPPFHAHYWGSNFDPLKQETRAHWKFLINPYLWLFPFSISWSLGTRRQESTTAELNSPGRVVKVAQ